MRVKKFALPNWLKNKKVLFFRHTMDIDKWVNYKSIARCAKTFHPVIMRQVLVSIVCNSLFRRTIPHQFRRGEIINQRARIRPPLYFPWNFPCDVPHTRIGGALFSQSRRRLVSGHDYNYNNFKDTHADIRKGAKQWISIVCLWYPATNL